MDTKSKKFNDRLSVKICAFILCALCLISALGAVLFGMNALSQSSYSGDIDDTFTGKTYVKSNQFEHDIANAINSLSVVLLYQNEDAIKKGTFVDPDLEKYKVSRYYYDNIRNQLGDIYIGSEDPASEYISEELMPYYNYIEPGTDEEGEYGDFYEVKAYDKEVRKQVLADYGDEVEEYYQKQRNQEIDNQIAEFTKSLGTLANFDYYVSDGEKFSTSFDQISGLDVDVDTLVDGANPAVYVGKGYDIYYGTKGSYEASESFFDRYEPYAFFDSYEDGGSSNISIFLGMKDDYYQAKNTAFDHAKSITTAAIAVIMAGLKIFLITLIYLIVVTGRKGEDGEIKVYRTDKLFTEFQLTIFAGLLALSVVFLQITDFHIVYYYNETVYNANSSTLMILFVCFVEFVIVSAGLWIFLSMIRMFKARIFLSRSIIVIVIKSLYNWIRELFSKANPMGKFVLLIILGCVLSMTVVLAPVVIALYLAFGYRWAKKYTEVKKGVDEVTNGNLNYKIPVLDKDDTEFDRLARQINEISQASNIAIQNELKNQRLKTDLISNVSHDLKTPLTSIITYTDLLKKEGLDSPNAERYLAVLDEKGQRLKNLTEDLFEAAKASSGSIPVRLEKVDILSLINQGLVELGEGFDEKELDVIINADKEKYYVNADSQLLWRVVENLLSNVNKYALENSRVYIDLTERQLNAQAKSMILFEIKNMSKAPLNIPESELMERFKRGDESRNTEGSGLGLAIAKDLIRLQNGWFELKIDGDLFKASVMLEPYNEESIKAAAEAAAVEEKIHNIKEDDGMPRIK